MKKKGFTLTEMLIVVFIISSIMALVVPNLFDTKKAVEATSCEAYIKMANSQVQLYILKEKQNPTSLQELIDKNYLNKDDPCHDQYSLELNQTTLEVIATPISPIEESSSNDETSGQ